jgi:GTP cyclohydrolase I
MSTSRCWSGVKGRHERIIGISKLTRLVRLFARRFTVQERLGGQIADALAEAIEPHGVAVHLEASTYAYKMPGVRKSTQRRSRASPSGRCV